MMRSWFESGTSPAIEQHADKVGHFCSGSASIGVKFVNDQMENM